VLLMLVLELGLRGFKVCRAWSGLCRRFNGTVQS
jgi:hypothetical protein